jgi:hypothetical protein
MFWKKDQTKAAASWSAKQYLNDIAQYFRKGNVVFTKEGAKCSSDNDIV